MKTLRLPLKKVWFDMTKALIKGEDYRGLTPYWCNRFLLYDGKTKTVKWWSFMQNYQGCFFRKAIQGTIESGTITFKHFDTTTLTLEYPSNSDKERIIEFENLGVTIGYGKEEWGAEPNKLYFVIKHGKRIE